MIEKIQFRSISCERTIVSIRVSGSSTGTASPIQIDGRENCVTEIERLEAAKKDSAAALL